MVCSVQHHIVVYFNLLIFIIGMACICRIVDYFILAKPSWLGAPGWSHPLHPSTASICLWIFFPQFCRSVPCLWDLVPVQPEVFCHCLHSLSCLSDNPRCIDLSCLLQLFRSSGVDPLQMIRLCKEVWNGNIRSGQVDGKSWFHGTYSPNCFFICTSCHQADQACLQKYACYRTNAEYIRHSQCSGSIHHAILVR